MNREIKYRAWDDHNKRIVPFLHYTNEKGMVTEHKTELDASYPITGYCITSLMQFTGIYDLQGNEVFEDDIVQTNFDLIGVVSWSPMASQWWVNLKHDRNTYKELTPDYGDGKNYCQWLTVIGNLHQHQHLLR